MTTTTTHTTQATVFRELHRLRRHAKELQDQIERGPRLLQAHEAKITRQQETVQEAQDALKRLKLANHEKETSLKSTHAQIAKYEKQRNEATTRKEYDTLQVEIGSAKQACAKIEDEILEGMGRIEEQAAKVPEAEKAVQQARKEHAEFERKTRERLESQRQQLEQVGEQIKAVEASLPADVRPVYERLVHARGEDALAAAQGGHTCSACYTEMTAQMHNDLLSGRLVLCKACGRILYLPE
jgi:predicted  nucleic acid-binding Zn-ribbon protein